MSDDEGNVKRIARQFEKRCTSKIGGPSFRAEEKDKVVQQYRRTAAGFLSKERPASKDDQYEHTPKIKRRSSTSLESKYQSDAVSTGTTVSCSSEDSVDVIDLRPKNVPAQTILTEDEGSDSESEASHAYDAETTKIQTLEGEIKKECEDRDNKMEEMEELNEKMRVSDMKIAEMEEKMRALCEMHKVDLNQIKRSRKTIEGLVAKNEKIEDRVRELERIVEEKDNRIRALQQELSQAKWELDRIAEERRADEIRYQKEIHELTMAGLEYECKRREALIREKTNMARRAYQDYELQSRVQQGSGTQQFTAPAPQAIEWRQPRSSPPRSPRHHKSSSERTKSPKMYRSKKDRSKLGIIAGFLT